MKTIPERVEYAQGVIDQSEDASQNDDATNATDLIAELMHWAQARDLEFSALVASARMHFEAEDEGQDVDTMSDAAYGREFGAAARRRRKARRDGATVPAQRAVCDNCGRSWPADASTSDMKKGGPDPLDGDWYARLDTDGIVPVAICPAPCGALVYLSPSQWVRR